MQSRIVDSFIDNLGAGDPQNLIRWTPELTDTSLIPSMVDALMLEDEDPSAPSEGVLFSRRNNLELFEDNDALTQM